MVSCFLTPDPNQRVHATRPSSRDEIDGARRRVHRRRAATSAPTTRTAPRADLDEMTEQRFKRRRAPARDAAVGLLLHGRDGRRPHPPRRSGATSTPAHRLLRAGQPVRERDPRLLQARRREDRRAARASRTTTRRCSSSPTTARRRMDGGDLRQRVAAPRGLPRRSRSSRTEPTPLNAGHGRLVADEGVGRGRLLLPAASSTSPAASREGIVPADGRTSASRDELTAKLEALGDENGRPDRHDRVPARGDLRERAGSPPDLIVYFGDLDWRSVGTRRHGRDPRLRERHRARTTRTTRTTGSTSSPAGARRPARARSGRSATSPRRSSRCSASPCPTEMEGTSLV